MSLLTGYIPWSEPATTAGAFTLPERLEYELSWIGIPAGTAILSAEQDGDSLLISTRAVSNSFISVFYRVDDRAWSHVAMKGDRPGHSLSYRLKTREGRRRKDKEVIFDHAMHKVFYRDNRKGISKEMDLDGEVFDPLGGFFSVRTMRLEVGTPVSVKIFDSKRLWEVEVDVLREETISVPAGRFETIVIKPGLKSEGLFRRKGDIFIWLTRDARRIPVRLQTEAPIGHITAELKGGIY